jgi:hypothetical protein
MPKSTWQVGMVIHGAELLGGDTEASGQWMPGLSWDATV